MFNITFRQEGFLAFLIRRFIVYRWLGGLKKKFDLRSGSQRHRPSNDTGPPTFYGDSYTPPHLVAFYDHAGDTFST